MRSLQRVSQGVAANNNNGREHMGWLKPTHPLVPPILMTGGAAMREASDATSLSENELL